MIAGPFLGEFGWECAMWVPWLRYKKHQYKNRKLHVICLKGHSGLYTDFADKITEEEYGVERCDNHDAWIDGHRLRHLDYLHLVEGVLGRRVKRNEMVDPTQISYHWQGGPPRLGREARYHRYTQKLSTVGYSVLVHARMCKDKQPERNWSEGQWNAFNDAIPEGLTVACVGDPDQSLMIPRATDLRGMPLAELIETIVASKFMVGPSSGPLALSLQCDTPVVWWSPNQKDIARFKQDWNPHHTNTVQAARSWNPMTPEVVKSCRKFW